MAKRNLKKIGVNEILGTNVLESGGKGGGMGLKFDFSSVKNWFKSKGLKAPKPLKQVKAKTDKAKLKIATENKAKRAPAIAEGKEYRESFGSHRVVEPTQKQQLFPKKSKEDYNPNFKGEGGVAKRVDHEMSIMGGTDKKEINRLKKDKENRSFLDKGYKIENVGPKMRDLGDGKSQRWVTDTDVDVAINRAFQTGTRTDLNKMIKLGDKQSSQLSDKYKNVNKEMVDHHTSVVEQTRNAPIGKKTVSRVYLTKEPPELKAFGQGKEQDVAGLKSDLGKATQHGTMQSFTPEELAHPTTQKFLKVTRDFGAKQAQSKKLSTGDLGKGKRAFPKDAKISDLTGESGKAFRQAQDLKIANRKAGQLKAAETRKKKQGKNKTVSQLKISKKNKKSSNSDEIPF